MDRHIKNGMVSMGVWIIFLVVLFGSYLTITDTPFSCLLDEETGGFISATFFIAWALIWFGIGRHYSLDYELKEQAFIKKYEGIDETIRLTMFKKAYFSNIAHMLSRVFFIAVPFYVAANVKDTVTLKNCIYIAILMIASIALYGYKRIIHHIISDEIVKSLSFCITPNTFYSLQDMFKPAFISNSFSHTLRFYLVLQTL